jgi:hypothetical protein
VRFNILKRRTTGTNTVNLANREGFTESSKLELAALMLGAGNQLGLGQPPLTTVAFSLIRNREVPRLGRDGPAARNRSDGVVNKPAGGVASMLFLHPIEGKETPT